MLRATCRHRSVQRPARQVRRHRCSPKLAGEGSHATRSAVPPAAGRRSRRLPCVVPSRRQWDFHVVVQCRFFGWAQSAACIACQGAGSCEHQARWAGAGPALWPHHRHRRRPSRSDARRAGCRGRLRPPSRGNRCAGALQCVQEGRPIHANRPALTTIGCDPVQNGSSAAACGAGTGLLARSQAGQPVGIPLRLL